MKWRAVVESLVASSLWGFGFIATSWALQALNAFEITFLRFALAGLAGLPFILGSASRARWKINFRLSFVPALFLAGTLLLQTWGMQFTTATKSGFITTLYVIFVPLLEALLRKKRLGLKIWLCVAGALIGTGLIVDLGLSELNVGDVLTFFCAVLATGQIYWMGVVSPRVSEPFTFNIYQSYWALLFTFPFVLPQQLLGKIGAVAHWPVQAVWGLGCLAIGSTVIAFFLQVRAQATISATLSSLIFLLESPFAMFFSVWLLGETLRPLESVGALMIFGSALFATYLESRRTA